MERKITFHKEADAEVTEAARYYEPKSEELGFSFLAELEAAIDQTLPNPEAYQRVGGEVRRATALFLGLLHSCVRPAG